MLCFEEPYLVRTKNTAVFSGQGMKPFLLPQEASSSRICVSSCLLQVPKECFVCNIFIASLSFHSYEFHVKPKNPLGEGPSSSVVAFSTESGKNFQKSEHHLQWL